MAGSLIDLMGEWLTRVPPHSTFGHNLTAVVSRTGSVRGAARELGVAESTLRGWLKGKQPKAERHRTVYLTMRRWLAGRRLDHAREDGELTISGSIRVSGDERTRTIYPGRYIPRPLIRRALTYWANGNDRTAEATLLGAIDRYYTPMEFMQIDRVWFE